MGKVACARCGYTVDDEKTDVWEDDDGPSFCSRECYDAGLPPGKREVEIDDVTKHAQEILPCGCEVEYLPPLDGVPARIEIEYCGAHRAAEGHEARIEKLDNDVEELRERLDDVESDREEAEEALTDLEKRIPDEDRLLEVTADREEMLERLGMTEHEWAMRRTWFGQPPTQTTLALVQPIAAKRGRSRIKKA